LAELTFNEERCKGCGLCVTFCPKKCLHVSERLNKQGYPVAEAVDLSDCTGCCFCAWMCPDVVITVRK
jgi:2-oxoglutarate ferredoxin oxidoreductase subunit delta